MSKKAKRIASVRTASRQGWSLVEINDAQRLRHEANHWTMMLWVSDNIEGAFRCSYTDSFVSRFAFQNSEDATFFSLRWS